MKLYLKFGYPSPPPNTRFGRGLPAWQIQRRSSIHRYPCTMNSIPAKGVAGQKSLRSACDLCHQGKVKCSGGTPCDGCDRLGVRCIYSTSNRTGRPKGVKNKKTLERIKQLRAANLEDNDSPSSQYVRCDSIDFFSEIAYLVPTDLQQQVTHARNSRRGSKERDCDEQLGKPSPARSPSQSVDQTNQGDTSSHFWNFLPMSDHGQQESNFTPFLSVLHPPYRALLFEFQLIICLRRILA